MVAWYWLIIAFISGLVFTTVTWNPMEWDNILAVILAGIATPFIFVAMFPIAFFRNYFRPVSRTRWKNYTAQMGVDRCRQIGKNVYLWHDIHAKKLYNKWFWDRVKEVSDS